MRGIKPFILFVVFATTVCVGVSYAGSRTLVFNNETGQAIDDLHITLVDGATYDAAGSSPFLDDAGVDGGTDHDLSNGTVPIDGSATVRFTSTSPKINVQSWYWTSGGTMVGMVNQGPPKAKVSVSVRQDVDGEIVLEYAGPLPGVADSDIPKALALDVTVSGAAILDVVSGYGIFPSSIDIRNAAVDSSGAPKAKIVDETGVTEPAVSSAAVSLEMDSPDTDVLIVGIDSDCNVSIAANSVRGGVLMEDPDQEIELTLTGATVNGEGCSCPGDIAHFDAGSFTNELGGDGIVDFVDLNLFLQMFTDAGLADYDPVPPELICFDIAQWGSFFTPVGGPDGIIDFCDLNYFMAEFVGAGFNIDGCLPMDGGDW